MRKILFIIIGSSFIFACSYEEKNTKGEHETVTDAVDESPVSATHIATFEVEGMMCQKGCGSILRKGLYETGGVSEVDVAFDEDNPVNQIKVYFDNSKTSVEEMISLVGTLANEQYSARLIGVSERTVDQLIQ